MSNSQRRIAVMLAVVMVLSVAVPVAALNTDTETTNSAGQSDLTDTSVIDQPHNSSKVNRIQLTGDSNTNTSSLANPETEMTLRVVVNDSNSDINNKVLYESAENWSVTTVSSAPDHYYRNVSNEKWGDNLEYAAEENVSVDFRTVFNESESDESVHNITVTVAPNGSDARVLYNTNETKVEENKSGFLVETMNLNPFGDSDDPGPAEVSDTTTITNKTDTVTMVFENSNATDSASHVTENNDGATMVAYTNVNDTLVPVVVGSASDVSWLDTSSDAYVTLSSSSATMHNAGGLVDDSSNSRTIDTTVTLNEDLGWDSVGMLRDHGAGWTTALTEGSITDVGGEPTFVDA